MNHIEIEIINCEKRLKDVDLDALVSTVNVEHKPKYLQTLMNNLDNNFKGYFVVATMLGEVVAWTYIFLDNRFAFHGVFCGMLDKLYRLFPVKVNTAFISSPIAEYNVIHIKESHKSEENIIIDKMMDELLKFLKGERVKLVIMRDHVAPYTSDYLHEKFIHVHFMPGTFVDFEGLHDCGEGCLCFEDYLTGLQKKRRANIRNKMNRRKEELKIEIVPAASLSAEEKERCHALYVQTREKQRLKHERLAPGYFHDCANELGDTCKMLIARVRDKIIGFALLFENEDDIVNVRMGMDYKYNKEYDLYYHLLYENIMYCLQGKKKRLYTSQTCYRPKLEVGAKLLPLHTYFRFTNPIMQKVLGKIIVRNCHCYTELLKADRPSEVLAKYKLSPY